METSPFNLSLAIQQWRETLEQSPAFRSENLAELETHLRDSIATLQARGLSVEEAFMIAAKRIGKDGSLEKEFRKINGQKVWLDRILWMLIGVQVWAFVSAILGRIARGALAFGFAQSNYDFQAQGRVIPLLSFMLLQLLVYLVSLALCWWLIVRKGDSLGVWFARHLVKPTHVASMCCLLWVLSSAALVLAQGFQMLPFKVFGPSVGGELSMSQGIATSWVHITAAAALIALTLNLARRRLTLDKA
jgi:hypothetical protein